VARLYELTRATRDPHVVPGLGVAGLFLCGSPPVRVHVCIHPVNQGREAVTIEATTRDRVIGKINPVRAIHGDGVT
jgi:hypothetical protein